VPSATLRGLPRLADDCAVIQRGPGLIESRRDQDVPRRECKDCSEVLDTMNVGSDQLPAQTMAGVT